MNLSTHTVIRKTQGHFVSALGDTLVILNRADTKYYTVNEVGKLLWDSLDTPRTVDDLCAIVQSEYEVERAECEGDVLAFVERFIGVGLFEQVDTTSG